MRIFNNLPGANGHSLTDREELWLAAMFRFLIDDYEENGGGDFSDIDYIPGEEVNIDKVRNALQKHIDLYQDYRPNTWYETAIPEALLTPPNYHIRILVGLDSQVSPEMNGPYYRLLYPSRSGKWYYTREDAAVVEVDLAKARLQRWMIVSD